MDTELLIQYFKVIHRDLNKLEFKLGPKNRIYFPLFSSSIEHCMSIYVLNKQYLTSSMYALVRPTIENYLRAMWVKYCNSDISMDTDVSSMHFPKKVEYLIAEVDKNVPSFSKDSYLQNSLGPLVPNIHDFTHGGIQSIARQYKEGNMLSNLRNDSEIESILNLTVLISSLAYAEIIQDNVGTEPLETQKVSDLATKIIGL